MGERERRLTILQMVQSGEISADEGSRWIAALEHGKSQLDPAQKDVSAEAIPPIGEEPAISDSVIETAPEAVVAPQSDDLRDHIDGWTRWWAFPFAFGILLTVLASIWMYQGWEAAGMSWGFWLSWLPFSLGLGIAMLSWYSQSMPWLYARIHNDGGAPSRVAFSVPLPVGLAAWGLKRYEEFSPADYRRKRFEEIAGALDEVFSSPEPIQASINGNDGEQVEILIVGRRK